MRSRELPDAGRAGSGGRDIDRPGASPDQRVEAMARIVLRPIGSPLPLGFAALSLASLVLSGDQLHWVPVAQTYQVAVALLAFVAPLQLLAAVFGFLARDSVGGTGMGVLAGTWAATGILTLASPPQARSATLGLVLLGSAGALLAPMLAATQSKVLASLTMAGAATRFALTGVYDLTGASPIEATSGWWGVGLVVLALYATVAFEIEDTQRRTVLPVGRRKVGRAALEGSVMSQLTRSQHEAGIREQL